MIRTQIYLPKDLYQEVSLVAKKEKKLKAQLVRELLQQGLHSKRQHSDIGKALLELTKIKGKGPKNLSADIDRYLYKEA